MSPETTNLYSTRCDLFSLFFSVQQQLRQKICEVTYILLSQAEKRNVPIEAQLLTRYLDGFILLNLLIPGGFILIYTYFIVNTDFSKRIITYIS